MIARWILCLAILSLLLSPSLAQAQVEVRPESPVVPLDVPRGGIAIPFELVGDQPVFEVEVQGEGPYRFILDTGAAGTGRVSRELREKLGFEKAGEVLAGDPSGKNAQVRDMVRVEKLTLGEVSFRDLDMLLAGGQREDEGIDGILGFALFGDALLTLDYPARTLRLEEGELPPADGEEILELGLEHGIPSVRIDVAGVPVKADIDSGSMGWVMVPEKVARKVEFASEPQIIGRASTSFNSFDIKQGPLKGAVSVGRHRMENPPLDFAEIFPAANLGGQFLGHFAVTFDQKNRRVRFLRDEEKPLGQPARYRVGIMLIPGDGELTVQGTAPGSPGERAGLREGDRIVGINGRPLSELGQGEMRKVFGSPEEVVLEVRRGEETLELRVTPEKVGG
jgi:hypothetical protein